MRRSRWSRQILFIARSDYIIFAKSRNPQHDGFELTMREKLSFDGRGTDHAPFFLDSTVDHDGNQSRQPVQQEDCQAMITFELLSAENRAAVVNILLSGAGQ